MTFLVNTRAHLHVICKLISTEWCFSNEPFIFWRSRPSQFESPACSKVDVSLLDMYIISTLLPMVFKRT